MKTQDTLHKVILPQLRELKEKRPNCWEACCPNAAAHKHQDKSHSFNLKYDPNTDKILAYCQTGCSLDDICAALGCSTSDLMPEPTEQARRRQFAEWYAGANGLQLLCEYDYCYGTFADGLAKLKFRDAQGKKTFRWIKADPTQKSGFKMTHEGCPNRLYISGDPGQQIIFLAEGEKDADTLHRLTGHTAASTENGATKDRAGSKWRDEYTQQLAGKDIFILWDNDEAGRNFARIQAQALAGHAASIHMLDIMTIWPDCQDTQDISDAAATLGDADTAARLRAAMDNAPAPAEPQEATEQPQEASPQELFDSFFDSIQTERFKPIQTGIREFDMLLGGGILRHSLVILSAAPGTGKTTLTQQIFEVMAAHGTPVVFFNLEMSREQLLARSMSRMIHSQGHNMMPAQVLQGYSWTDYQREYVTKAAEEYRRTIAGNMQYNPAGCTTDIEDIRAILDREGQKAQAAGQPAPAAVLDYLHLITSSIRDEQAEILKKTVAMLKDYATKYDTFAFAISATNRTANASGTITMEAGRDTSALEYSADYLLALNYQALAEKKPKADGSIYRASDPNDMEELQNESPRKMIIQVLKNRMNAAGGKIYMDFDSACSVFTYTGRPQKRPVIPAGFTLVNDPDIPVF